MGKIILLDEQTSNQIAAGEVVEGPASIVKEMVENAVDAGATQIQIEIKNGGVKLIRISDNGSGMERDDVELAFERHATSKIKRIDDLESIVSMGFRGEALASIASVSRIEMQTKTNGEAYGTKVILEGGQLLSVEPTGCPEGTTFIVKDLFYNTPARYKFLKKDTTEAAHVIDVLERLALAHPDVSIQLISNGSDVLRTPGNGDLASAVYSIYGKEVANAILPVSYTHEGITVSGYIGKPSIARGNRTRQTFLMNNRYIQSRSMTAALDEAYKTLLMTRQFAFAVIVLAVPTFRVDINVHPAKLEVRFSEEKAVFSSVHGAVKNALLEGSLIGMMVPTEHLVEPLNCQLSPVIKQQQQSDRIPFTEDLQQQQGSPNTENLQQQQQGSPNTENLQRQQGSPYMENLQQQGNPSKESLQHQKYSEPQQPEYSGQENRVVSQSQHKQDSSVQEQFVPNLERIPDNRLINQLNYSENAAIQTNPLPSVKIIGQSEQDNTRNVGKTGNTEVDFLSSNQPTDQPGLTVHENQDQFATITARHPLFLQMRIIGQVLDTYIVLQYIDEMILLDQHAAHERIRFEELKDSLQKGEATSQQLLQPILVHLSAIEYELAKSSVADLNLIGFEVEKFGNGTMIVRGIPTAFDGGLTEAEISSILTEQSTESIRKQAGISDERLHSISCKGAIKANQAMGFDEIRALLERLSKLENPYSCVHGRPTLVRFPKNEIEKRFKRIV